MIPCSYIFDNMPDEELKENHIDLRTDRTLEM